MRSISTSTTSTMSSRRCLAMASAEAWTSSCKPWIYECEVRKHCQGYNCLLE
jgi:hypothetical protein